MPYDRGQVLKNFLLSDKYKELSTLTEEEISNVGYADNSGDLLTEVLKTALAKHSADDSQSVIQRALSLVIEQHVESQNDN